MVILSHDFEPFSCRESRHDERPKWAGACREEEQIHRGANRFCPLTNLAGYPCRGGLSGVDPLSWTGIGLILKPFRVLSRYARRRLRQHQTGLRDSFQSSGVRGSPGRCGGAWGCTSLQSR